MKNPIHFDLLFSLLALATPLDAQVYPYRAEFSRGQVLEFPRFPNRTELLDLNGDGHLDLLGQASNGLHYYFGAASGHLAEPMQTVAGAVADVLFGHGDVDGDGDIDLIAGRSRRPEVRIFRNDGAGRFTPDAEIVLAGDLGAAPVVGDFDGDRRLDLAFFQTRSSTREVALFLGNGAGGYLPSIVVAVGAFAQSLTVVDLDHSGADEIVLALNDGWVSAITSGSVPGSFEHRRLIAPSYPGPITQVADYDLDGHQDLLLVGSAYGGTPLAVFAASLLRGTGSIAFGAPITPYVGVERVLLARIGNVDGLGAPDLMLAFSGSALVFSSATTVTPHIEFPYDLRGSGCAGDIDGDGDLDLVGSEGLDQHVRFWINRARFESHFACDETRGTQLWDSGRGDQEAVALQVQGATRWQGDPGPGRAGFRGNTPGTGMLVRGSGAYVAPPSGVLEVSAPGSSTSSWMQRMGPTDPHLPIQLPSSGVGCYTGIEADRGRVVLVGNTLLEPALYRSNASVFVPGRWIHLAITYDHASRELQLFVDGVPDGPPVSAGRFVTGGTGWFGLGHPSYASSTDFFDFDEIRHIPRKLSQAEIAALGSSDEISIAPMGEGCYERGAEDGLIVSGAVVPGGLVELLLNVSGSGSSVALLAFGISSSQLGASALPIDLGNHCWLRTSLDVLVPLPGGVGSQRFVRLPAHPGAMQGHVYVQALLLDQEIRTTRAFDLRLRY